MGKDKGRYQEDLRQLGRWQRFTGAPTKENAVGRWKSRLINMMKDKYLKGGMTLDEILNDRKAISPVIRQSLQHWGYMITRRDLEEAIGQELFAKDLVNSSTQDDEIDNHSKSMDEQFTGRKPKSTLQRAEE